MRGSHLLALMASSSALAMAAPAFAADNSKPSTVQEVTVTAEKRSESIKDVPMSVSALPQEQLEKLNAVSFEDYAKLVPGLNVESADPGASRLTLRGLNAGGVASTVAIYVDETPFGSSSGLVNGSVLAGNFDTYDVSRIEVLRGPQGTFYGSNTEGGLVKFVTNAPNLDHYEGSFQGGVESIAHGNSGWSANAMVNIPMGDAALRLVAYHDELAGFIDNPLIGKAPSVTLSLVPFPHYVINPPTGTALNEKDVNRGYKEGVRAEFLFKPTDDFSLRLTAFGQDMHFGGGALEDVNALTLQPLYGKYEHASFVREPSTYNYRNYNALATWDLKFATLTSSTSYGELHSHYQQDDSMVDLIPGIPAEEYLAIVGFPGDAAVFHNQVDDDKFTEELRLTSPKSDRLEWQIGGYYTRESGLLNQALFGGVPITGTRDSPNIETPKLTSKYEESAVFADATYHFTPAFDIQVGGRYSVQRQHAEETVPEFGLDLLQGSNSNIMTWSIGPRWHIDANNMVYARVATGYRPGGPNVLPPGAPPGTPTTYNPDSNTSYEAGWKATLADGRFSIDAALYYIQWQHIQLFEIVNGFGLNGNGGSATSQGAEWAMDWRPISGLNFIFNGAYTDAKLTSNAPGVFGVSGDPLPWVPKWNMSLDGEYDWDMGDMRPFVGATWSWQSDTKSDFDSGGDPRLTLPAYSTVDARLGMQFPRFRIEAFGKNLADTHAFSSMGGIGSSVFVQRSGGVITPRTLGLQVSTKW